VRFLLASLSSSLDLTPADFTLNTGEVPPGLLDLILLQTLTLCGSTRVLETLCSKSVGKKGESVGWGVYVGKMQGRSGSPLLIPLKGRQ
jgi:hypothetical protein